MTSNNVEFNVSVFGLKPNALHRCTFTYGGSQDAPKEMGTYEELETQVHGDIVLDDDVEILVADPSFKGTEIGNYLEQTCINYSIELFWHMGFEMRAEEVPSDFRGPSMPSLAKRIASNGNIDASVIGSAVNDLKCNPGLWSDRGNYEEVLQELKYMWHILVRYGKSIADQSN